MIFLSLLVHWILPNRSSWMQKYSWSEKVPSSFSGIPIKVHLSVLLNYNILWLMINLFLVSSSYGSRLAYSARNMDFDTWLLFLISIFPNIQYTISTLWLFIHLNSETTSRHLINIIDSQRRGPHHYKSDCGNYLYYLCKIGSFQSLLLQYKQTLLLRYVTDKSWSLSLFDCFNITPWTLYKSYPKPFLTYPASYKTKNFGGW